jgi:hypothetical protein
MTMKGKCARGRVRGYPSSVLDAETHLATFSHKGEKENGLVMRGTLRMSGKENSYFLKIFLDERYAVW